jgi:hypothetical protein
MTDTFLLLTPLLVLAIVALLGFVGCQWLLHLGDFIHPPTFDPPAGAYFAPQMVKLQAREADQIEVFFEDGTSQKWDGNPIPVSRTLTLRAVASKSGYPNAESKAKYYIGPILYQQGPAETSGAGAMTDSLGGRYTPPFPSPLGAGNLVLVWVFYRPNWTGMYVSKMDDGINTKYTRAIGPTVSLVSPIFQQEIWFANNIATVSNARITVSFYISPRPGNVPLDTPPLAEVQISAHEYTNNYQEDDNLADAPPVGTVGTDSNNTPGNLVSSGTVTATTGRKAFGAAWFRGSGMSQLPFVSESSIKNNVVEDVDVTSPGSPITATFVNATPTEDWMAQIITLK